MAGSGDVVKGVNWKRTLLETLKGLVYAGAVSEAMSKALENAFSSGGLYADALNLDFSDSPYLTIARWVFFTGIFIVYGTGRAGALLDATKKEGFDQRLNPFPIVGSNLKATAVNFGPGFRSYFCCAKAGDVYKRLLLAKSLGNLSVAIVFGGSVASLLYDPAASLAPGLTADVLKVLSAILFFAAGYIGLVGFSAYQTDGLVGQYMYVEGVKKEWVPNATLRCRKLVAAVPKTAPTLAESLEKNAGEIQRLANAIINNVDEHVVLQAKIADPSESLAAYNGLSANEQQLNELKRNVVALKESVREKIGNAQISARLAAKLAALRTEVIALFQAGDDNSYVNLKRQSQIEFVSQPKAERENAHSSMPEQHGLRRFTARLNAAGYVARAYFSSSVALAYMLKMSGVYTPSRLSFITFVFSLLFNSISPSITGYHGRSNYLLKSSPEIGEEKSAAMVVKNSWGALLRNATKTPEIYKDRHAPLPVKVGIWVMRFGSVDFFIGMLIAVPHMFYATVTGGQELINTILASAGVAMLSMSRALQEAPRGPGLVLCLSLFAVGLAKALYDTGHYNIGRAVTATSKKVDAFYRDRLSAERRPLQGERGGQSCRSVQMSGSQDSFHAFLRHG